MTGVLAFLLSACYGASRLFSGQPIRPIPQAKQDQPSSPPDFKILTIKSPIFTYYDYALIRTQDNALVIELSAVGMGVAPEATISPSQALALAKRAAIVDAYRQLGEKMYGIRVNAQDTVRDMVLKNSTVKTKVMAVIRNAEIIETIYKDGLCQVNMELKLDGKRWYRILTGENF